MRRGCVIAAIAVLSSSLAPAAAAQGTPPRPVGRLEIAGGVGLFGGHSFGSADATIRANTAAPTPFLLFSADSRLGRAPVVEARLSTALTRRYEVEGRFSFSRPELRSSISADVEGAPGLTVVERIDQYVIDGALLVLLDEIRIGGAVPFASAGAGYLRQLHEGLTVIESGRVFHIGGGVKHWFFSRARGVARAAGVRGDARLYFLSGGIALDDGPRSHVAISGSFFVTF
jgi:hypothetical protein